MDEPRRRQPAERSPRVNFSQAGAPRWDVRMPKITPFGNPDGSRSDLQEVLDHFVSFDQTRFGSGLGIRFDDLSVRVIVGAKGSGKTVYLRRLQASASSNASRYADVIRQDLPTTANIVKFGQLFPSRDLTERWMQLWNCAITRSLVSHMLFAPELRARLSDQHRESILEHVPHPLPKLRTKVSVYSQLTDIIASFHTEHQYAKYFDHPGWAQLYEILAEAIRNLPPIYLFLDSVDEEYSRAPMFWMQCQKGLFYTAMRLLRDANMGSKLHVITSVRDHVLSAILRSEHRTRYQGEPHIRLLTWDYDAADFFLRQKIDQMEDAYLLRPKAADPLERWLGTRAIENLGRGIEEPASQYLLRHTRLLARDVVILGNQLTLAALEAKQKRKDRIDAKTLRRVVRRSAKAFGDEHVRICANQISSNLMPPEATRKDFADLYTGDTEYVRGVAEQLRRVIRHIGIDRFGRDDMKKASRYSRSVFGKSSDVLSVLWQNRLLGYTHRTADGRVEVFFSEENCDDFNIPLDKEEYVFHSCVIDSVGIDAIGQRPIGAVSDDEAK